MKLSKTLRIIVRVREFETVQIEVGAEASHYDLGYTDEILSNANDSYRNQLNTKLEALIQSEVDKLAREELEKISTWSDFHPNLADDYLGSSNARATKTDSPPTRRLRR